MSKLQYQYKYVNVTLTPYDALQERTEPTIEDAANHWAANGWRTVSVIPSKGPGYAPCLLIERVVPEHVLMSDEEYNELRRQVMEKPKRQVGMHDG